MKITTPLTDEVIENLRAGDQVYITGKIYTARDAAHKRLVELLKSNQPLPFDIKGQIIYYVGPTPAKPGQVIGSAGPTTSSRMDPYTPVLLEAGLKGMIGKGERRDYVKEAIVKHKAIYFAAIGGAGALIARTIRSVKTIAYEDLGAEAIRELEVVDFPAFVVNDIYGNDLMLDNISKYRMEDKNE